MKIKRFKIKYIIILFLVIFPIVYSLCSSNPVGTSYSGEYHNDSEFEFIYDISYQKNGEAVREQKILDESLRVISEAEDYIVADLFLFNDEYDKTKTVYPESVKAVTEALTAKKKEKPDMPIILITDPINNFYGAYEQKYITVLKDSGISVVITELDALRDSNPILSGYYRCYTNWLGTSGACWLPNFFEKGAHKVNLRSVIKLANFKANHRKVIVTDKEAIVSSANPHDASGYHSNIAVSLKGNIISDLLESEKNIIRFSGANVPDITYEKRKGEENSRVNVRVITEKAIFDTLKDNIDKAQSGDEIHLGIFYISDFDLLKALGNAADRGVKVRIVADPNKDAFGIEKNGSPNRSALCSLSEKHKNAEVRWYATNGEQYHTKIAVFDYLENNETRVVTGSSNFTRRNFKGYNLECNVEIVMPSEDNRAQEIKAYFDRIWENKDGEYTLPTEAYYEKSVFKDVLWRVQEITGLCSW